MEKIFEIKSFARIIPSAELLFGSFFDNNGAKSLNLMSFGGNAVSKGFKDFSLRSEGQKELFKVVSILTQNGKDKIYFSQKINLFDKIFFEEKVNSKNSGSIEIRGKGKIKFPTNANNICFFVAKEMQKFFAKKNKGTKPNGIKITIEKNIPLHSGLGGAVSNAFETMKFLNDFWKINLSEQDFEEKFFDFLEKFFGGKSFCFENFFSTRENFFS
ncbi:hypothetical protein LR002_02790, partial [Candidatus Gracilibacteria bacterium]|nr:hypothetical protein [Candidatus Gracilibacteria bacterium]